MRIQILGTAAAEGWPALFCECEVCRKARRLGGRDVRRRTSYAVNRDVLIDFGPDVYWQSVEFGVDLADVRHILLTHSHHDHLDPPELQWRHRGFSTVSSLLRIHGNRQALERTANESGSPPEELQIRLDEVGPGHSFPAGSVTAYPVEAQHASDDETALNYVLSDANGSALIANDTGWWTADTWAATAGRKLDAAILECTYGMNNPDARSHHLGCNATVAMRDELVRTGALKPQATVVASHFSHNGGALHAEMTEFFTPHGIAVGYDGMVVDTESA